MRTARIKVSPVEGEAVYHCMTRTVNGERLLDDPAKETLRKQLWQVADYCGVQILTYTILSNHFHVLARVPPAAEISDIELLRRYRVMYPKPTPYQAARLDVIEAQLKTVGPEADAWRKRQLALMGDISQFMKLLKQRFSVWFNRSHRRYGTLWSERFKSVLLEPKGRVLETMAAYIDLNCVRAGLAADPKDYRFCGYAEAVAGGKPARAGLAHIIGESKLWSAVQAAYRESLFGKGSVPRERAAALTPEQLGQVLKAKARLPLATVLRCRIRYFTDGAVLGGKAFVAQHLARYRRNLHRRAHSVPRPLPALTDWGGELTTLRGLRKQSFGL
ncbi:transposase [Termitidicoccus mucosus]|uniref:Transposase n=1 Tax=Termitidicoccus mucosus TaxID=1184151 RepID=A0A178IHB3_9BACT|nr:transposase [Opitutaceae bacterium TSB47]